MHVKGGATCCHEVFVATTMKHALVPNSSCPPAQPMDLGLPVLLTHSMQAVMDVYRDYLLPWASLASTSKRASVPTAAACLPGP